MVSRAPLSKYVTETQSGSSHRIRPPLRRIRLPPLPWHPGTVGTRRPSRSLVGLRPAKAELLAS